MSSAAFAARVMRFGLRIPQRLMSGAMRAAMGTITHVETEEAVAALTFDDGPHPVYTPRLLDILARHRARATFFMIGENAARYPDLVRRVAAAGHAIGNHSWNHPRMPSLASAERRIQIRKCAHAIAPYGSRLFRPPRGLQTKASRLDTLWLRHRVITWSIQADDWMPHDAIWTADHLERHIKPGSIILLHDMLWDLSVKEAADRSAMLEGLDRFLDRMRGRYRFLTVPELLRTGRPARRNWYVKHDDDWADWKRRL